MRHYTVDESRRLSKVISGVEHLFSAGEDNLPQEASFMPFTVCCLGMHHIFLVKGHERLGLVRLCCCLKGHVKIIPV